MLSSTAYHATIKRLVKKMDEALTATVHDDYSLLIMLFDGDG
jgi:hypothetical protein